MNDKAFERFITEETPMNLNIQKYLMVTRNKLSEYRRISIAVSGGSDSAIVTDMVELVKPPGCGEISYIFFDTGLEYEATRRYIGVTELAYGITVERIKPRKTIPIACREHGIPFICKDVSDVMGRLQRYGFDWYDLPENATPEKYGRCKSALDWYFNRCPISSTGKPKYQISRFKLLREFIMSSPPDFAISDKCCDYTKKDISKEFDRDFGTDLTVNGMRRAEGGRRVASFHNCFTPANNTSIADYRPLWFWTDEDKRIYKEWRGIRYSDCYELWGFKRTGCVGCPCSSKAVQEIQIAGQYEPNKVKAAFAVFGESYEYREAYNQFKKTARQDCEGQKCR